MNNKILVKGLTAVFAIVLLGGYTSLVGQDREYKVEAGERVRVRLENKLSSKISQVGDRFTTKVVEPVYSTTGVVVIPEGSSIIGRVDAVEPAKKGGKPGSIDVTFIEIRLPNGSSKAINGSLTNLDTDDAKSDPEGTASGDRMEHRKVIFIGGGGAGGAVIGAAIGGGKGALIGGIAGAIGGLIGEKLTKGEEAEVKAGTEFGVYMNREVYLPRYQSQGDRDINDDYAPPVGEYRTYVVQPGDTLGKISIRFYGTSSRYMDIYNANRDKLSGPGNLTVGQELRIP
ncbi:MAG: LysM peptidoglycan-binding domain-containing protein [Acidobacteria bacterium]|nr:MAG: LysM peptidoglycan-binding domain-containing protein [Acidobacteriota bacterium]REJ98344.1 MAG: LysM peptidoglycan-binding domain-containing protein [Acidobacteriota bacterium]REK17088.1 MAG: LysM peptidoglycan-binding domain-containing protein [Acidobacteriota bacterium]REK42998.1 MAG: LysM peptidoglycan-binding domain-containing protein [Acidobacteriota bacterium]